MRLSDARRSKFSETGEQELSGALFIAITDHLVLQTMLYSVKAPRDISGDIFTGTSPIRAIYPTTLDSSQRARATLRARSSAKTSRVQHAPLFRKRDLYHLK